ncbi:MAG: diaminopimelate epimerase [Bacillota bacterium]
MKEIKFTKMHGIGNDFIIIDGRNLDINFNDLAKNLCKRHFSIGADGLIVLNNPKNNLNDYKMRIFNADGSEAEMCGNGIRCFTHFIKYKGLNNKNKYNIETLAGIYKTEIKNYNYYNSKIEVKMGKAKLSNKDINLKINGNNHLLHHISMGNPHTVLFVDNLKDLNIKKWGSKIENLNIFKDKTNVEFVQVQNENNIKVRVWERGVGETLACGTGACASAVISNKNNLSKNEVNVNLKGGKLKIRLFNDIIYMLGKSKIVFQGEVVI